MPVDLAEIDEVLTGLSAAKTALERRGCHANEFGAMTCMDCYTLFLVENAIRVYHERALNKERSEKDGKPNTSSDDSQEVAREGVSGVHSTA